jgi:hypothetical protein
MVRYSGVTRIEIVWNFSPLLRRVAFVSESTLGAGLDFKGVGLREMRSGLS